MKGMSYISYNMSKYQAAQRLSNELTRDAQELLVEPGPLMHKPLKVRENLPAVRRGNMRAQLLQLGLNQSTATIAIPYGSFLPRTSDADAQGIQVIVKGIQKHFGLPRTGYLDSKTGAYIRRVAGPTWFDMNWASLISHVLASPKGKQPAPKPLSGMGDDIRVGLIDVEPLPDLQQPYPLPSPFKGKKPATFVDFLKTPAGLATLGVGAYLLYTASK